MTAAGIYLIVCAGLIWLIGPTVRRWDAAEERRRIRDLDAFRAQLAGLVAADEAAWDEYVRQAPGLDETPIWTATAAYIAEHQGHEVVAEAERLLREAS